MMHVFSLIEEQMDRLGYKQFPTTETENLLYIITATHNQYNNTVNIMITYYLSTITTRHQDLQDNQTKDDRVHDYLKPIPSH